MSRSKGNLVGGAICGRCVWCVLEIAISLLLLLLLLLLLWNNVSRAVVVVVVFFLTRRWEVASALSEVVGSHVAVAIAILGLELGLVLTLAWASGLVLNAGWRMVVLDCFGEFADGVDAAAGHHCGFD